MNINVEKYNFDTVIDRKNTNSLKYDFMKQRGKPDHVLPLWVADMDFRISQEIIEALHEKTKHGIFGYSEASEGYFEALQNWMKEKHQWNIEKSWIIKTPGVVFALAMAVQAFTNPGDGVMIQQPVYYPFSEVIRDNHRRIVDNTLVLGTDGSYQIDFMDFEKKAVENKVKLFLLCSPHNPVGRVWTSSELKKLGAICTKHDIIIVSDEIHHDFIFKGKHQIFADISEELKNRIITCTSPSKTFNLAGLQVSNIVIANQNIRRKFKQQMDAAGYSQLNTFGLTACEAAYRHGNEWYKKMMDYKKENISFLKDYINENIPQIRMTEQEGTYLVWLDFRGLDLTEEERENLIVNEAGLWLDSGAIFGAAGEGFERINIACPRIILKEALQKLEAAIKHGQ